VEHEQEEARIQPPNPRKTFTDEEIEIRSLRALRGQIPLYIKGYPDAAALRARIVQADTYAQLEGILREYESREVATEV
jgi:tRNA-dihydrouridine synthase